MEKFIVFLNLDYNIYKKIFKTIYEYIITMDLGTHLIVDLFGIKEDFFLYNVSKENYPSFDSFVEKSLISNHMNIVKKEVYYFNKPEGAFTSAYLLAESHLTIHTWPENKYIALDIFTCGEANTIKIVEELLEFIKPETYKIQKIKRG